MGIRTKLALFATAVSLGFLGPSLHVQAEGMPQMRGVDHIGITVPDIQAASHFFTDVLGCEAVMSFGPFADPEGSFMEDALKVHKLAVIEKITQIRCGNGSNIELFQYTAPDQKVLEKRNSDVGAYHIGLYVDDIEAAAERLKAAKVETFMGPIPITEGPAAGQTILYFLTPWGLQMELISYPDGMAYEKETDSRLWSPRDVQ